MNKPFELVLTLAFQRLFAKANSLHTLSLEIRPQKIPLASPFFLMLQRLLYRATVLMSREHISHSPTTGHLLVSTLLLIQMPQQNFVHLSLPSAFSGQSPGNKLLG